MSETIRERAFAVVDKERDYQELRWERPEHVHSATEYLVYIDHYVKQGMTFVSTEDGERGALGCLRKIAALAVAAMEENGIEEREERE